MQIINKIWSSETIVKNEAKFRKAIRVGKNNYTLMNWFIKVLKQYADFKGRARRKEYWMYVLFLTIAYIIAAILDNVLGLSIKMAGQSMGYGYIYLLVALATIVPSIAVSVRRLQDINKSGWFVLIAFIPIIGVLILLYWSLLEGTKGENQYGPDPKAAGEVVNTI